MKLIKTIFIAMLICFLFPLFSSAGELEDAITAIADKDYKKACEILATLAEENNLAAKTYLGTFYIKGQGVEPDFNKGLAMIMDAANQGFDQAQFIAVNFSKDLAEGGDVKSMYNMGYMCLKGWGGGDYDPNKCLGWLEGAAQQGHKKSAKVLAQIYENGSYGVTADKAKASEWSAVAEN